MKSVCNCLRVCVRDDECFFLRCFSIYIRRLMMYSILYRSQFSIVWRTQQYMLFVFVNKLHSVSFVYFFKKRICILYFFYTEHSVRSFRICCTFTFSLWIKNVSLFSFDWTTSSSFNFCFATCVYRLSPHFVLTSVIFETFVHFSYLFWLFPFLSLENQTCFQTARRVYQSVYSIEILHNTGSSIHSHG